MRRRSLLRTGIVLPLGMLAGCSGAPTSSTSPSPTVDHGTDGATGSLTDEPTPTDAAETSTKTSPRISRTPTETSGLDLREANVTGVSFSASNRTFDFDVTLHHDDDGEDGYANWWQIERLDGTRLGRRELLHAHGTREFTRSASIEIPTGVTCVLVRGHDQEHGYGGQAALVNLDSGANRFVRQGPDPRTFSVTDCP